MKLSLGRGAGLNSSIADGYRRDANKVLAGLLSTKEDVSDEFNASPRDSQTPQSRSSHCNGGELKKNGPLAGVSGKKTRIEQAEARTKQAEARTELAESRTEQAESRTELAETRTEQAESRTESAETRTEQAETRTELAKTRTEQAEIRTEQAETALQHVVHNEIDLHPGVSTRLLRNDPVIEIANQKSPLEPLTGRQREILQLIAEGKNTKQIGEILKVSPKTVEYHRMKLMVALNLHDIPGLVRFALKVGLIPPES